MCLGIPGRIVELDRSQPHLATVEVAGVRRRINIGLVIDEGLAPGDHVLIHVGFAMARIDEGEARRALEGLRMMGPAYDDEIEAVRSSRL